MKHQHFNCFILVTAFALLLPAAAFASDEDSTNFMNHLSFSARVGFNINARFKNLGSLTLLPGTRTTPDGTAYNYNNGYVLTDVSGNAGGQTWNWGYDSSSQISGNNILMNRTTPATGSASPDGFGGADPGLGWELNYNRQLGTYDKWRFGVEAAINYMRVSFNDHSSFSANASQTTDVYPYTTGTTPPVAPYQGTFNGPGFLLGSTPISSTTTIVPGGATVVGQREFGSDVWGARLGPYVEYPLTERLDISLSAGLAAALLNNSASWNETVYIGGTAAATSSGSGNNTGFVWGGYVSADVSWQLSKRWSVEGGVQYQNLGVYDHDVGTREVELDLSKSLFVLLSVGYKF